MPSLQEAAGAIDHAAVEATSKGAMTTTLLSLLSVTSEKGAAAAEEKVEWLRSQLIGKDVEFDTPFGRRALTYADQTASGRSLRYIEDYLVKEVLPYYGNTHTEDSHVGSKTTRLVHKAARYVKRCMGAGPGDALLFCGAGTTAAIKRLQEAIGVAVPSAMLRGRLAAQLRDEERWVVFVGPYEHHSNLLSWRRSLAEVVEVGVDADGLIDVAALRRALSSPEYADRPMLGSFSACSNVTGVMTDTREIARVLHQHGAFACFDFAARCVRNTHTEDSHVGSKTTRLVHKAARYIKRCMGAGPGDALLFCGAGSTAAIKRLQEAIGVAVPSAMLRGRLAAQLRDEERWVVFVGPYEHHSNLLSWRRSLAEVVEVGVDADGLIDVAALRRALSSPEYADRPMLGSFSACSNVTGVMTDTRELARVLHQHGAFACFDFAASGPYVKIDMKSGEIDGYDTVFLSPHKFVGGPGTPGVLLMNKSLYRLNSQPPSTCGGGTVAYVNGFSEEDTLYYGDIQEREDAGTPPIVQKIRASLAFWVKEYIGYDTMGLRERVYSEMAMKRLVSNPNIRVLGNTNVERLPVFSFLIYPPATESLCDVVRRRQILPLHGRFVTRLLNDLFGIQARGGCACAGPYGHLLLNVDNELSLRIRSAILEGYSGLKPGWTRLSFAYYLSKEEFKFILSAIEFIAAHGHRFLRLYKFDWITGNWTFRKQAVKYHIMREELSLGTEPSKHQNGQSKAADKLEKPDANHKKFESYMESAKKIALSLPDTNQQIVSIPKGVDPELVLFHI